MVELARQIPTTEVHGDREDVHWGLTRLTEQQLLDRRYIKDDVRRKLAAEETGAEVLCCRATQAGELPPDRKLIEILTMDEAKELARKFQMYKRVGEVFV